MDGISEIPVSAEQPGPPHDVPDAPWEPARPTADIRAELQALLEADESRLGDVYRALNRGLNADAIAEELGVATSNFVWNYQRTIGALIDRDLPTAPTVALQTARRISGLLKRGKLSPSARNYLEANWSELERRANDEGARVVEVERAKAQTEQAEARNESGIYVYALPHYVRYPYDPESGRTLMKVGRSDSDVIQRFRNQTRTTALPEEPILLRIYRTQGGATSDLETSFHRLLNAADHAQSVARTAGREWFLTTTRFLDEIARVLRLPVEIVNDSAADAAE
jgi:hypothetical protein